MLRELLPVLTPSAVVIALIVFLLGVFLWIGIVGGEGDKSEPMQPGLAARATLKSPSGEMLGTVRFRQTDSGVLIEAEADGLAPGGHAFIIHEIGACSRDFGAAGGHLRVDDGHGFIHANWKGKAPASQGGDLPNIHAAGDGTARADFFTTGVTLNEGHDHSVFDADGSAIVVHELPDQYDDHSGDFGERVACGVIEQG